MVVVLHGHGDDVDPDNERDEEVEVVASAERVDGAAGRRVIRVVGAALGLCRESVSVSWGGGCLCPGGTGMSLLVCWEGCSMGTARGGPQAQT